MLDPESSRSTTAGRREQRGAEHDHAGASVTDEPGVARPPRASRIDGCITAAASRKYAIGHSASSGAAVGVGAVGDEPRVDGVGDQHRRRARAKSSHAAGVHRGQREHRVHDHDDEHDVHQRVQHGHDAFELRVPTSSRAPA